ncbi:MAG: hypothetical protein ABW131_06505 [Candidatus Sedimenticola sp. 6PFRAG5]
MDRQPSPVDQRLAHDHTRVHDHIRAQARTQPHIPARAHIVRAVPAQHPQQRPAHST